MTDYASKREMEQAIDQLVDQVRTLRRDQKASTRAQPLRNASIDGGRGLVVKDQAGAEVYRLGTDPTTGVTSPRFAPGPAPAQPSTPMVVPGAVAVKITLDGLDVAERPAPADFKHALVHVGREDFEPDAGTVQGVVTDPRGTITVAIPAGTVDVRVQWVTLSGQMSVPSEPATVDIEPLVDVDDIQAALQTARDELAAATTQAGVDLAELDARLSGLIEEGGGGDGTGPVPLDRLATGTATESVLNELYSQLAVVNRLTARTAWIGGAMINDGQITTPKLKVTEDMTVELLKAHKVQGGEIDGNTFTGNTFQGGTFNGAILRGGTVETDAGTTKGVKFDTLGIRAFDDGGQQTIRLDGKNNLLTGRLQTNKPGEPGLLLVPTTSTGTPGIWFSDSGDAFGTQAAIYADSNWNLNIRPRSNPDGSPAYTIMRGNIHIPNGFLSFGEDRGINENAYAFLRGVSIKAADGVWRDVITPERRAQFAAFSVIGANGIAVEVVNNRRQAWFTALNVQNADGVWREVIGPDHGGNFSSVRIWDSKGYASDVITKNRHAFLSGITIENNGGIWGNSSFHGKTTFNDTVYVRNHPTTGSGANAWLNANLGILARSTSARKYKKYIRTVEVSDDLLNLEVKDWIDRGEDKQRQALLKQMGPLTEFETLQLADLESKNRKRIIGMVAEDVEAVDDRFVTYDADGAVDGLAYDRLAVSLFPIVRRQRDRIEQLEAQNAALAARLDAIEERLGAVTTG